jgi:hypothetical protein
MMRRLPIALLFLVMTAPSWGVPGATPMDMCEYSEPAYTPLELTGIRDYQACVQAGAANIEGNEAAGKCARVTREIAADGLVEAGSTPEWKLYPLRHIINECAAADAPHRGKPGRYTCEELVGRYPQIAPAIQVCREIDPARKRDQAKAEASRAQCRSLHAEGYALERECRKVVQVIPPMPPPPASPGTKKLAD